MVRSVLTVTSESESSLLAIEDLRVAAGLTASDASRDPELAALGESIAASIAAECNVAKGIGGTPTLLKETLSEVFYWPNGMAELMLSRRHEITITSVTIDGDALSASDTLVDPESGMLLRLEDGCPSLWCGKQVTVVYQAGFATTPADLRQAAIDFFKAALAERARDPFVKGESTDIPGVITERRDYWVGSIPGQASEGPVPDITAGQLKRYRNIPVG